MVQAKKKFYVVWEGKQRGIFDNWNDCRKSVEGFGGALYKSFSSREEAVEAFKMPYGGCTSKTKKQKSGQKKACTTSSYRAKPSSGIAVDGACSRNPGSAEYRGVRIDSGEVCFSHPPILATNNIVEFLAIVHAMALCLKNNDKSTPIYSDSRNAIIWVNAGKCKTTLAPSEQYAEAHALIQRAEIWLANHPLQQRPPLRKWETEDWGENPADYGRK